MLFLIEIWCEYNEYKLKSRIIGIMSFRRENDWFNRCRRTARQSLKAKIEKSWPTWIWWFDLRKEAEMEWKKWKDMKRTLWKLNKKIENASIQCQRSNPELTEISKSTKVRSWFEKNEITCSGHLNLDVLLKQCHIRKKEMKMLLQCLSASSFHRWFSLTVGHRVNSSCTSGQVFLCFQKNSDKEPLHVAQWWKIWKLRCLVLSNPFSRCRT